ncbi:DUF1351 domain-containing protein [Streptococcus sp. 10F2]
MVKDVTNSMLTKIDVDFVPATISVDYELVEKQLAEVVSQYENYEVTAATYKVDYDERTRLNKLKESLEQRRKEIKDTITNPYKEFEKRYRKMVDPLDQVINQISEGLKAIDEHEKMMRVDHVRSVFEDRAMVAGLEKDTFADKYEGYSLKKYFKAGKIELKKTTLAEIDSLVLAEFDALEEYKANKQAIEDQAQEYELPAESYLRHLENGQSLVDVLSIMKADRDAEVLRKEQRAAKEQAEAERKAEIEKMAKEQAQESIKAIDTDTGEILEEAVQAVQTPKLIFEQGSPVSYDLRLTFPQGKVQAKEFKDWLEANGVQFEVLYQGKTQTELSLGSNGIF